MSEAAAAAEVEGQAIDTGLVGLCLIARHFRIAADAGELARRYLPSSRAALPEDIMRIARKIGLKSRIVQSEWERLSATPLPALAECRDGSFVIATRIVNDRLMVHRPGEKRVRLIERADFEAFWSRRLILVARRASLSALPDVFDLRWFFTAVYRYFPRSWSARFSSRCWGSPRHFSFKSWSTRCLCIAACPRSMF